MIGSGSKARPEMYLPFATDRQCDLANAQSKRPCFKVFGLRLSIWLVPANEVHFVIDTDDAIVRKKTDLPFPSLPALVESLLKSGNILDLEELTDATSLREKSDNGVDVSDELYADGGGASPKDCWERIIDP